MRCYALVDLLTHMVVLAFGLLDTERGKNVDIC